MSADFSFVPHPRVLRMLGEINLDQWRCVAELIDNSVDAFIHAIREGAPTDQPQVVVNLPTSENPLSVVTVRDNGPGMSAETLQSAVSAGWSSNDPLDNLGLFGMGFNIATARLGTVTQVWTTQAGQSDWLGLEIDLDKLVQQGTYTTPPLSRPKNDPVETGTEIRIARLKSDQLAWFAKQANRSKVSKELARVYSAMLRDDGDPVSFTLQVNNPRLRPRIHCVWGDPRNSDPRVVSFPSGRELEAFQMVERDLGERPYCINCWKWLPAPDAPCPDCGLSDNVVMRRRQIRGWLGVQRYLHTSDFGIDFIRNGRKIEIANKDLFYWENEDGVPENEYTDDPRRRGRLVGEIHIDHARVSYSKDRFDRNDPAWDEMILAVRGLGPLRPKLAQELGFGENTSPLFRLFQAFRRSTPKPKVALAWKRLLAVEDNDKAEEYAKRFYDGDADFQSDQKWWDLVEEQDLALLEGDHTEAGIEQVSALVDEIAGGSVDFVAEDGPSLDPTEAAPQRIAVPSLSQEYADEISQQRWRVSAFEVSPRDADLPAPAPWTLRRDSAADYTFLFDPRATVFRSATLTPLDALLAQLAWSAADFDRSGDAGFAAGLASLRSRYATRTLLDPISLSGEASNLLTSVARCVVSDDETVGVTLFEELSASEKEQVQAAMAVRAAPNPQAAIGSGRFLEYSPRDVLIRTVSNHPDLFFDGKCWDLPYETLDYGSAAATDHARRRVLVHFRSLLEDAAWLVERDPADLALEPRSRLLRAALALELLSASAVEGQS
ncbi:MAG: ATP-binding protein [Coriobacteriia bacterium]|nr:ATP-binding protein [Coriobacteriia bacterium]